MNEVESLRRRIVNRVGVRLTVAVVAVLVGGLAGGLLATRGGSSDEQVPRPAAAGDNRIVGMKPLRHSRNAPIPMVRAKICARPMRTTGRTRCS